MKTLLISILFSSFGLLAKAESFFVSNGDVNALIAAIQTANNNNQRDTIYLVLFGIYNLTNPISSFTDGESGLPDVKLDQLLTNKIIVYGNGATLQRDQSAAAFRIWMVFNGSLELHDVVIKNGKLNGTTSLNGGGIANYGEFAAFNSTFVGNVASFWGGALYSSVAVPTTLTNCTVTSNKAAYGGAIFFYSSNAIITNCTIVGNTSLNGSGKAVYNILTVDDPNRRVFIKNSIIASNKNNNGQEADVYGTLISYGHNLVGECNDVNTQVYLPVGMPNYVGDYVGTIASPIDPLLNVMANNGGFTPTISLQGTNSLAFNSGGFASDAPATDQVGNNRLGNPEMGSLEFNNNAILAPAIAITQNGAAINNNGQYDFGSVTQGSTVVASPFNIKNTGIFLSLNLLGKPKIYLTGKDSLDFIVGQSSTTASIGSNSETIFNITLNTSTAGSKTAHVTIVSNDVSLPVFMFTLKANIVVPAKTNQSITFENISDKVYGDVPFTLNATASSALSVVITSSNTSVATVLDNIVTITGAGNTIITASQAGNNSFNAAPDVEQALKVNKAGQTIIFDSLAKKNFGDDAFDLTAIASSSLSIIYSSSNISVALIDKNTVTIVDSGITTITASQPGDTNYNPAVSVDQSLTVSLPSKIIKLKGDLNFGEVEVGKHKEKQLIIVNSGSNEIKIADITFSEGFTGVPLSETLQSSDSVIVDIIFSPTETIHYTGQITVLSDATGVDKIETTGIGISVTAIQEPELNEIEFFPNPGSGIYFLRLRTNEKIIIDVIDSYGREQRMSLQPALQDFYQLDLRHLNNGVYILCLTKNRAQSRKRFIKN